MAAESRGANDAAFTLPLVTVVGNVFRMIPSQFPVIGIWDSVGSAADLEDLLEVESLTNPRVAVELEQLRTLPREQWITGEGATPVMAAICNPNRDGSRFADHSFGTYYAAGSVETAIKETVFHTQRFLRTATKVAPDMLVKRRYDCRLALPLPQITATSHPALLLEATSSYPVAQAFGKLLRHQGAPGIHYPSVRDPGQFCVAIFDPRSVVLPVTGSTHYQFHWDGHRISHVNEIGASYRIGLESGV